MISEKEKQEYNKYVEKVTPDNDTKKDMANAFWIGGSICLLGQCIFSIYEKLGVSADNTHIATAITLIFISAMLTGLGLYPKVAKVGGAGCLVPITGFANGVAAPALEFKTEGQIFGIGTRIFVIAGPVILYGILTSFGLGVVYYLWMNL